MNERDEALADYVDTLRDRIETLTEERGQLRVACRSTIIERDEARAERDRLRELAARVVVEWDCWLSEAPPEWIAPGMQDAVNALRGEGE